MNIGGFRLDPGAVLIMSTGAIYFASTFVFMLTSRPWMGIMYAGYVIGNIGAFGLAMGWK
jgi:hypothetical protein